MAVMGFHTSQYCVCTSNLFSLIKVALKEVTMVTTRTATAPLPPTAWGPVWGVVVEEANATGQAMDRHPQSTVLTLTPRF